MHISQNSNSLEKRKHLNGIVCHGANLTFSSSSLIILLHPHWRPAVPQTYQAHSCLRDFALAVPSAWNVLPPRYARGFLPHPLQVSI